MVYVTFGIGSLFRQRWSHKPCQENSVVRSIWGILSQLQIWRYVENTPTYSRHRMLIVQRILPTMFYTWLVWMGDSFQMTGTLRVSQKLFRQFQPGILMRFLRQLSCDAGSHVFFLHLRGQELQDGQDRHRSSQD